MRRALIGCLVLCFLAAVILLAANFAPATIGCWMAHGDNQGTAAIGVVPPLAGIVTIFHDTSVSGGAGGDLGCSSNNSVVACSYNITGAANVYEYSATGSVIFSSSLLDGQATRCTPMIGSDGGIIICDDTQMVRLGPTGSTLWDTCFYGGTAPACQCSNGSTSRPCPGNNHPINFVQLSDGSIALANDGSSGFGGALFQLNSSTGAIIAGPLYLGQSGSDSYTADKTPCVNGTTIFDITSFSSNSALGRMYSVTFNGDGTITTNWSSNITGPSGSSTLCLNGASPPEVIADSGDPGLYGWNQSTGTVIFDCLPTGGSGCTAPTGPLQVHVVPDPRGGFWWFTTVANQLNRYSITTGASLQTIATSTLVPGESHPTFPSSDMTMTTDSSGNNVMLVSLQSRTGSGGGSYITALNLNAGTLVWSWTLATNSSTNNAYGQMAVVTSGTLPFVVVPNALSGMYLIGSLSAGGQFLSGGAALTGGQVLQ